MLPEAPLLLLLLREAELEATALMLPLREPSALPEAAAAGEAVAPRPPEAERLGLPQLLPLLLWASLLLLLMQALARGLLLLLAALLELAAALRVPSPAAPLL